MSRIVNSIRKERGLKYEIKEHKNIPVWFNDRERYILDGFNECSVTALTDTHRHNSHCFIKNERNTLMYDPTENEALQLTKNNLSRCCGKGCELCTTYPLYSIIDKSLWQNVYQYRVWGLVWK